MSRTQSDYWSFGPSRSIKYAEVCSPLAPSGVPIRRGRLDDLPEAGTTRCIDGRSRLPDCIRTANAILILSIRAANLFREFHIGDSMFVPLGILDAHGNRIGSAEMLLSTFTHYVDMDLSSYVPISKETPRIALYFNESPVVRRALLHGLDFAESIEVARVCSLRLKTAIEKSAMTNFSFEAVDVR